MPQLKALIRLIHLLVFKERKVLVNIFVISNFNHCFLAWNFSSVQSLNKKPNQATFRTKSLMSYGPKIWDALPYHTKCWDGKHFTCRLCEHVYIVYVVYILYFCIKMLSTPTASVSTIRFY